MSSILQKAIEAQQQAEGGKSESQKKIGETSRLLAANQDQINSTKQNIDRVSY